MFRDRRFLRCLRADAVRSPRHPVDGHRWPSPRFWHHVFDIPRFRVWYKCKHESSGDRVGVLSGSVKRLGQDGAFPWVLSLEEPCRGREVRSHFRHILPWPSARLTHRCRLVVLGQPPRGVSVGKVSSFTLRVGRP
jgi:hypothetical protein